MSKLTWHDRQGKTDKKIWMALDKLIEKVEKIEEIYGSNMDLQDLQNLSTIRKNLRIIANKYFH